MQWQPFQVTIPSLNGSFLVPPHALTHGLLDSAFTTYADAPASQAAVAFNENALPLTFHSADASYIICILEREKKMERCIDSRMG